MPLFDTPLGEALDTALEDRLDDAISTAVGDLLEAIWSAEIDETHIEEAIATLEDHAEFVNALLVGDAAMARDLASFETRRRYCQMLIETGALHASEFELNSLIREARISDTERGEALGLLGRLHKQRYVNTGEASDLNAALASYKAGFDLGTDRTWHGVNLLALLHRSRADDINTPEGLPDVEELAEELLITVRDKPPAQQNVWDLTTEIEILVALDRTEDADEIAKTLATSRRFKPFHLRSLRRQLTEMWNLDETHHLLLTLSDQMLQHGRRAQLELPDSPEGLEKIFGAAGPVGYNTLLRGLHCAESVCKITDVNGEGWGTGFLITGDVIDDRLGDETFIATNAHVVSTLPGVGALQPVEAEARFDVLRGGDDDPLLLDGLTEIWSSPPNRCDVTLLRFEGDAPKVPEPIKRAPALPLANEGAFVYVVGHPAGAGLKLSIRGNDLLAYDRPQTKVHYIAPTEPGSSGSPVFTPQWQLMGVHHAGSSKMRRLDNPSKSYEANEGITIDAIRDEFQSTVS